MGQLLQKPQEEAVEDMGLKLFDQDEEETEEIRMLSNLEIEEIFRLKKLFLSKTDNQDNMTIDMFRSLPGIGDNPLCGRMCSIIGFTDSASSTISIQQFIVGIGAFNSLGQREQKLKTAFLLQDYDNDGMISKTDLTKYVKAITSRALDDQSVELLVDRVFEETSSHPENEFISFLDFQRVVGPTDFHLKLRLPI
jgi:Ca2+-binding EF-hand superfamily protein